MPTFNSQPYTVSASAPLSGLTAHLDKLIYHDGGSCAPPDRRHAFIYYITIQNRSSHVVTLLGRKWVLEYEDGRCAVIEGDKIVGETPRLVPGEAFSYNSYHLTSENAQVHGSFHGVDETGARIHVILPPFAMTIPSN
ncbi:MAG: ApaG domain [Opitutaceae bacterium]|nr:ApaG domain [Opitutaceae bacterium]